MRIKSVLYVSHNRKDWTIYAPDNPDDPIVDTTELAARYRYVQSVTVYLTEKGDEDAIHVPPPKKDAT